jgi:hypothetical protein
MKICMEMPEGIPEHFETSASMYAGLCMHIGACHELAEKRIVVCLGCPPKKFGSEYIFIIAFSRVEAPSINSPSYGSDSVLDSCVNEKEPWVSGMSMKTPEKNHSNDCTLLIQEGKVPL